jgi:hypothetical protein
LRTERCRSAGTVTGGRAEVLKILFDEQDSEMPAVRQ